MISSEEALKIENQIAELEKSTAAELVVVLVRRSSAVGHVPWLLVSLLGFLFLSVEGFHLTWQEGLGAVAVLVLSLWLSRYSSVQRLLTPNSDEIEQVRQRAELEFHRTGIAKTDKGIGVLIFVSLMERQAVILADQGVLAQCPPEIWKDPVDQLTKRFRQGQYFDGIQTAVTHCGQILKEKLPLKSPLKTNQLPNRVFVQN